MNLFKLIISAFSRLTQAVMNPFRAILRKVQQLFNANIITGKLVAPINKKVRSLLTLKPQSKSDYFSVMGLWVYKKVIYLIALILCAGVFIYFTMYAPKVSVKLTEVVAQKAFETYSYDDVKLAKFTGVANIKNADGKVIYVGDVASGICTGFGTLYNEEGTMIYQGDFLQNKYSGVGTSYYTNKNVEYEGEYQNNQYNGKGKLFSNTGSLIYDGDFKDGKYSGAGKEYDENSELVYEGSFLDGQYHGTGTKYFSNGNVNYTGEFYEGNYQGLGTLYSEVGKKLYEGQMYGGTINYKSLLSSNLQDIETAFSSTPKIIYSEDETCFLFEDAGVIITASCLVKPHKWSNNDNLTDDDFSDYIIRNGDDEYMPIVTTFTPPQDVPINSDNVTYVDDWSVLARGMNGNITTSQVTTTPMTTQATTTLPTTTTTEETTTTTQPDLYVNTDESTEETTVSDKTIPPFAEENINLYYQMDENVWVREEEVDKSKISIKKITVMKNFEDISVENAMQLADSSEVKLEECVAIDIIREKNPTAFNEIFFQTDKQYQSYTYIFNIDNTGRVTRKAFQTDDVLLKLVYQQDEPDKIQFYSYEMN